jgi:hypothetical protein
MKNPIYLNLKDFLTGISQMVPKRRPIEGKVAV